MSLCITITMATAVWLMSVGSHLHREIHVEILVELLTTIFIHHIKYVEHIQYIKYPYNCQLALVDDQC